MPKSSSRGGHAAANTNQEEVVRLSSYPKALAWIENHQAELTALSDELWRYAEVGLQEMKSGAARVPAGPPQPLAPTPGRTRPDPCL